MILWSPSDISFEAGPLECLRASYRITQTLPTKQWLLVVVWGLLENHKEVFRISNCQYWINSGDQIIECLPVVVSSRYPNLPCGQVKTEDWRVYYYWWSACSACLGSLRAFLGGRRSPSKFHNWRRRFNSTNNVERRPSTPSQLGRPGIFLHSL